MLPALQKCPRHLLVCEKSSFLLEKSRHATHVETHYYNYAVSFLLPECGQLPGKLKNTIDGFGNYYLVKDLSLHEFITPEFRDTFLKKGKLIISADKDTYEELGLQGKPSLYSGKKTMRYIVNIDLTEEALSLDGKKHQRVRWAFTEKKPLKFDFLLAWDNAGSEAPTIKTYFSKYIVKECPFKISSVVSKDVPCPVLKSRELHAKAGESCSAVEMFDWLGAVSSNIDCNNRASSFISSCCCPDPNILVERAYVCTITGFLTPAKIMQLLQQLREYFDEPKLSQWASLMVHGFADSPVSWRESEHGFYKGGENLYSFVIFNNEDYWLHMAVGAHDGCPP
ncbi:PREDICTED: ribonuclease P protein subunit p40 isoform X3 [Nanorana parkeri]|uniref:ribonuclease P protein subunit p40 isoform X3 n=1 Tax=Nanorana parkeri TaxID=125878 RepID=UPI000854B063|nr:PREDICTED: ribonuclease P protein subunit p40 isoform X3 [Nanorana parkeri]